MKQVNLQNDLTSVDSSRDLSLLQLL